MLTLFLLCFNIFITFWITILFIVSLIRLFKVKPICHWNFWILLFQLHINLFSYSLSVSAMVLFRHLLINFPNFVFFKVITNIASFWSTFNNGDLMGTLILICIERCFATIKNKTYEFSKNPLFIIVGSVLSYGFGVVNIFIWNVLTINYSVANISFYAIYASLIVFIIFLYIKNRKLIKLSQSANIILTQRYQIHENVRMLKYAIPFLIYPSSGLIFVGTFVIILRLFISFSTVTPVEMNAIYFTGSNIFILHSFYHANIKFINAHFQHIYRKNRVAAATISTNLKNNERRKEGDIYFAQLKNAW